MSNHEDFERKTFGGYGIIFEEGDDGDAAYLITRGSVEIRKGTRTKNPVSLAMLHKGDIFGEMALFDNRPRMAQAMAVTDVEVIAINREAFMERLRGVDPVMKNIILYVIQRLRNMTDEFMIKQTEVSWSNWKKLD